MTEVFPISCVSCRRKKIKCNKIKPCNQCEKRDICCKYPSTFRNIKINEDDIENMGSIQRELSNSSGSASGSTGPAIKQEPEQERNSSQIQKLSNDFKNLQNEKSDIIERNTKLNQTNKKLLSEITKFDLSRDFGKQDVLEDGKKLIPITGETSELGDKYYGPQSSSFMIDKLNHTPKESATDEITNKEGHGKFSNNELLHLHDSFSDQRSEKRDSKKKNELIKSLLQKKKLPYLLNLGPDSRPHWSKSTDLEKLNIEVIYKLVELFFKNNFHYKTFISKYKMLEFLDSYAEMSSKQWEHDDEILLLTMILLLLVQRITAKEFIEMDLIENTEHNIKNFIKFKSFLIRNVLFHSFEKRRHNLLNESITTIQSYILCTEWQFIEQRYEECWSMMFHTCSIAYSIGLHVIGSFGLLDEERLKERAQDISRYRVWFALKDMSGLICSVLGRPNPISIQVNSSILTASNPEFSKLNLSKYKILILLKIGLSECLKLSNMLLIENFMIDFTINDLLELDFKFDKEIRLLEWFIEENIIDDDNLVEDNNHDETKYNDLNNLELKVDKGSVLIDLITFYINRAKLCEPFIVKFGDVENCDLIVQSLYNSMKKYLDYIILFIESFLKQFNEKYATEQFKFLKEAALDKLLRVYFPFLNSFIYQGIIVIFTFLHYKSKEFIQAQVSQNINYPELLNLFVDKLNILLTLEGNFSNLTSNNNKLWSSNINYLIRVVLGHTQKIHEKQNIWAEASNRQFENELDELQKQFEMDDSDMLDHNFNLRDPFWVTNPDNLPYYLSSPSDEDESNHSIRRNFKPNRSEVVGQENVQSNVHHHPQPMHTHLLRQQQSSDMLIDDMGSSNPSSNQTSQFGSSWSQHSSRPSAPDTASSQPRENQPQSTLPATVDQELMLTAPYDFLDPTQPALDFDNGSSYPGNQLFTREPSINPSFMSQPQPVYPNGNQLSRQQHQQQLQQQQQQQQQQ